MMETKVIQTFGYPWNKGIILIFVFNNNYFC